MHFKQEVTKAWPSAVEEIKDVINLRLALVGDWQVVAIRVTISRKLVKEHELRPHLDDLRHFVKHIRNAEPTWADSVDDAHRLEMFFRR